MKRFPVRLKSYLLRHRFRLSLLFVLAVTYWLWLPEKLFTGSCSKILSGSRGELLAARIAPDGQWRFPECDSVPLKFKHCILAFEDEYFEYHPGINPVSLVKSAWRNIRAGGIKSGGSTLTMQVARMARGNKSRNYYQKAIEMLLAVRIELSYSKSSILNLYSSHAPFGSNVVGLGAAAWRYFGRQPQQLSWAECATLAVLPNAPSLIYPGKNQQRLLEKRNRLLKKLKDKGVINSTTYQLAIIEPLPNKPFPLPRIASHLLERCIKEKPEQDLYISTINTSLQQNADNAINNYMAGLAPNQVFNACVLIADTKSGEILAYVGNTSAPDNAHHNYVDIVTAARSTGSILKPYLYACLLDENLLLPNAWLEDVPMQAGAYEPGNFNLSYDGLVPAHEAIARSLNVPAVKMLQEYGSDRFLQKLKQLGLSTFNKPSSFYGLSLILGGGEANLWELTSAYAYLGRRLNGNKSGFIPLHYLQQDSALKPAQQTEVFNRSAIYFTLKAMTELLRPGEFANWASFKSSLQISWKTGTSFGFRDAWAIGLNSRYTVAVWVGNASGEGRPGLTGVSAAAPLMFSLFNLLPAGNWFVKPENGFEMVKVCAQSGFRASEICPQTQLKESPFGASKTKACPFHQWIMLNTEENRRVSGECYPVHRMKRKAWLILSPRQEYYFMQHQPEYRPTPPYSEGCANDENNKQLEILYPTEALKIYIPVTETNEKGRCVLKAAHKQKNAELFWYLDGVYIGSTKVYHELPVLPVGGRHSLEITDQNGESQHCTFEILSREK